ncbi:beta-ketoacyl synthase chain length factor [Psittacicella gerlachiana]|uniref:Beta-ketoacyl synthase-like N-terminal domain-containing protein n=1 Tax=Psittacicella gerlachiana TaxID=2028574 RepID=A0A3A1YLE6_9GAMM|nr:beta-ketoacyl synthase chain length factor [Psittacicella gerlachiana]RIY36837.1 hypothetical protein CKF59_02160 [Psittacicella gerlachiana]
MNKICSLNFNIDQWQLTTSKELTSQDWEQDLPYWLENVKNREVQKPKLEFLNLKERRRLSENARLIFASAWNLTSKEENLPIVYASVNGEVNRSFKLYQDFLNTGMISPTSFSLSVHNAIVGNWSIIRNITNETTAISSTFDNLEVSLLEAYCLLNEGFNKVLVILSESEIDSQYQELKHITHRPIFSYALTLVITQGSSYNLTLVGDNCTSEIFFDNNLQFVKAQYLNLKQWQSRANKGTWIWTKA